MVSRLNRWPKDYDAADLNLSLSVFSTFRSREVALF